eukprot:bmy_22256T0
MNDFYSSMCQDLEMKPLMLEEGQGTNVSFQGECQFSNIRVAVETFMRLPYRAKKFRLYCTKPVTLHIDFCEDSTEIVPAKKWDSAAIRYFQNILKGEASA